MHGAVAKTCFTAELCSGHGGFSLELKRAGLGILPVDHKFNQHSQKVQTANLDLTKDSGWIVLYELLESERLVYVHGAPPCGTATRARERRIAKSLIRKGAPDPRPLRSVDQPHGIWGLSGRDALRVEQANLIYMKMSAFFLRCHEKGIAFSVENPWRSLMWLTSWFKQLGAQTHVFRVEFDHCMHGGTRKKRS